MIFKVFCVCAGGVFGALLRWSSFNVFKTTIISHDFPYPTLFVNVFGSFLIGVFSNFFQKDSLLGLFFITGFLGAFTTFSTFSLDTIMLMEKNFSKAIIYVILSNVICILCTFISWKATKVLLKNFFAQ